MKMHQRAEVRHARFHPPAARAKMRSLMCMKEARIHIFLYEFFHLLSVSL